MGNMDKPANDRADSPPADATRSQPPVVDSDATRSQAPELEASHARVTIDPSDSFVDEPERYVIEGQIGAGGMGVVFAAKGARLGRPVAVKVITADREDLRRRFEREANVTARLQHPAIVPVYSTGRSRDGRPFYAMKQVSGEPLDKVIAKATTLEQRLALVPKVIAVTEAIAYAHAERVIHRDLKPANVLVGAFGETVVIDWGLAKDLSETEEETEAAPYRTAVADATAIGKVMGTPAYMPIEQARGERVDERSDVYALGAILYHVLGGVAPFARLGEASVPWESMLARVLSASPEPLETLQPGLPKDLLAIVARAMAKSADARYPTAGELAEDLKRFTTGQLVGAHRYSTWQLIRRWVRRHRTAVAVGGIAIVVLAVVGVVSVQRIVSEQAKTEKQRVAAVASRDAAEDLLSFMLGDLRTKLEPLGKVKLLEDVATKAVSYYDRRGEDLSDAELAKRAQGRRNLGDVLKAQGHADRALSEFRASLTIGEALAAKETTNAAWQLDLSASHQKVAEVLFAQGDAAGALAEFRASLVIAETVAATNPTNADRQRDLAISHNKIGDVLQAQGDTAGAFTKYRTSLAILKHLAATDPTNDGRQEDLSVSHAKLGEVLLAKGDTTAALAEFRAYLGISETLAAKDPTDAIRQQNLAISHNKVGSVVRAQGNPAGALAEYRVSLAIRERLAANDPTNADRQRLVSVSHTNVGTVMLALGDVAGALLEFRASQAIDERLATMDPTNGDRRRDLALGHEMIGDALRAQRDTAGALAEFRIEISIFEILAAKDPTNAARQRDLAVSHQKIGTMLLEHKDAKGALQEFRASHSITKRLAAKDPTNADRQADLSHGHNKVGEVLLAQGDAAGALAEYRAYLAICETLAAKDPTNANRQADLSYSHEKVGDALLAQGDGAGAVAQHRAARDILETMAAKDPMDADLPVYLGESHAKIGDSLAAQADTPGALVEYRKGLAIVQRLQAKDPKNVNARKTADALAAKVATCCARSTP